MNDTEIKTIVEKMANLARLEISEKGIEAFSSKVKAVLSYVDQLNELNTDGIEPTSHAVDTNSVLRTDETVKFGNAEEILAAAPERDGQFVQVPKVLDAE